MKLDFSRDNTTRCCNIKRDAFDYSHHSENIIVDTEFIIHEPTINSLEKSLHNLKLHIMSVFRLSENDCTKYSFRRKYKYLKGGK